VSVPPIAFDYDPAARRFRLEVDGVERTMPALEGLALANWHREYAEVYVRFVDARDTSVSVANDAAMEGLVDALAAYDLKGAIGREWIEENLTDEQLVLILRRIQAAQA
jgi:hypothetical protein